MSKLDPNTIEKLLELTRSHARSMCSAKPWAKLIVSAQKIIPDRICPNWMSIELAKPVCARSMRSSSGDRCCSLRPSISISS